MACRTLWLRTEHLRTEQNRTELIRTEQNSKQPKRTSFPLRKLAWVHWERTCTDILLLYFIILLIIFNLFLIKFIFIGIILN